MCPIPEAKEPSYRNLISKARYLLGRLEEDKDVEFKDSMGWNELRMKIIKSCAAMSNLRDGRIIILGVSQQGDKWSISGVGDSELKSYDSDKLSESLATYFDPCPKVHLCSLDAEDGKRVVLVEVQESDALPVICKKNGPDGSEIVDGSIYVRLTGPVRTSRVMRAEHLREVLDLAAERIARRILETTSRLGLTVQASDKDRFNQELGGH